MSQSKIKVLIYGIAGKMGKMNALSINKNNNTIIAGAVESPDNPAIGKDAGEVIGVVKIGVEVVSDIGKALPNCDIVIDFTSPEATISALEINKSHRKAFVIGTTGLTEEQNNKLKQYSELFPIVYSPNFSIGVNVLFKLVEEASRILNKERDYDLEIIEAHHRHKKDAPSGTAMKLLDIASENTGRTKNDAKYGRKGFTGERTSDEIGMSVIRAGDIVGEHTVLYSTEGERIEITHKAHSKETFSNGSLQAVLFVKDKSKGLFSMRDILGF
jgi:4-hydroxy-tetrahydrodipicolinate reductase